MKRKAVSRFAFGRDGLVCTIAFLSFTIGSSGQPSLQQLHGHVRPEISTGQAALVGPLSSTQQLDLSIVLPLRNESTLDNLIAQLHDPSSPNYRQFLSVTQFTQQFSPTATDYQAVVGFVEANGLTVTSLPANRLIVPIRGSVEQIERTFNVNINVYRDPADRNRTFFSTDKEPSVDLNVSLWHIAGLDNYSPPRPLYVKPTAGQGVQGNTTGSGPGGSFLGSDRRAAYYGGSSLNGSGQAVGLFELDGYNMSDVNSYFANVHQTLSVPITNVLLLGASAGSDGDDTEQVIDIIDAVSVAPGLSKVLVYIAPRSSFSSGTSDVAIFNRMASDDIAKQISVSWGWKPADPSSDEPIFKALESQGQNIFVASGDAGAWVSGDFVFPAEDPYVTAVGGTDLTTNGGGGSWNSETAWVYSGGGISPDHLSIPSYQQQSGVVTACNGGSTTYRNAPDVAAEANQDNYYCANGSCGNNLGGTSLAAPTWAGFMALTNQQAVADGKAPSGGLGFVNPTLYSIGLGSNYYNDLHDITSGNNGGYSACPSFDLVTGWGSPSGPSLISGLEGTGGPLPAATPYESNVTVNLHGMPPTSIDYLITFQDSTPGATIHYQVTICNVPYGWSTTTPGSQVDFYSSCPSITPYGTMYATAPGYLQSSSTSMSF